MPTSIALSATPRDLTKTPRALRREGVVPGVLYGHHFDSTSLQFGYQMLERVVNRAGSSQLVAVNVGNDTFDALVRDVQRDPVTGRILHVDLYHVLADEKLTSAVPIELVGEAPAVELGGILTQLLDQIEVECFPRDLPAAITVDLAALVDMHARVTVADLDVAESVTVLTDPESIVVQIAAPRAEVEEEEAAEGAEAEGGAEEAGE